jgi:hypothetical protein
MIEVGDINATQLAGLLAFGAAALACARAARARQQRLWWKLAAISTGFALEAVLGLRHRLRGAVDIWLQGEGLYDSRTPAQIGLLVLCALLLAWAVWGLAGLRRAGPHARVAATACAVTLCLFVIEAISLHGVDALMYANIGPVRAVGWVWVVLAGTTAWAAWRAPAQAGAGRALESGLASGKASVGQGALTKKRG